MDKQTFTIQVIGGKAINKLKSLGRKKGEYVTKLIEQDIRLESIEKRLEILENNNKPGK